MEAVIGKLTKFIFEDSPQEKIDGLEEVLEDSIEEIVDIPAFFEIPTENLLRIIKKSKTNDIKIIKKLVSNFNENKGEEAPLILNVVDTDASLDEYIEVLSTLRACPICKRISDIKERDKILPKRDYEGEIKELKQKNAKLEEEIARLKKKSVLPKVVNRPADFDENICSAAANGKITSVIYHIETLHTNVETKDDCGYTPLNNASCNGNVELVEYLVEHCHANVNTKDKYGWTPLNNASRYGNIDLVKYFVEHCHADVETKSNSGKTPLHNASANGHIDVVKYLVEDCHAEVKTKDSSGYTPLHIASLCGHTNVVKYLAEHYHGDFNDDVNSLHISSENREISTVKSNVCIIF